MNYGPLLLITSVLYVITVLPVVTLKPQMHAQVEEISVGDYKEIVVNSTTEYIMLLTNYTSDVNNIPLRVHLECWNCTKNNLGIVVFRNVRGVTSFRLPLVHKLGDQSEITYNQVDETLCPSVPNVLNENEMTGFNDGYKPQNNLMYGGHEIDNRLVMSLSSLSNKNLSIGLCLTKVEDFLLELGKNKTITITPTAPRLYFYEFGSEKSVLLKVESASNNCMIVLVSNRTCFWERKGTIHPSVNYQTMTHLGAFTVSKDKFPRGFYVRFKLYSDDTYCSSTGLQASERTKTIVITLTQNLPAEKYTYVISITILAICVFCLVMCVVFFCVMRKDIVIPDLQEHFNTPIRTPRTENAELERCLPSYPSRSTSDDALSIKTDSSLDETDYDVLRNIEDDKDIVRAKVCLCLSDLAKKNPTILKKKSELYLWNLMTVAIFYVLPASQLLFLYQNNVDQSGNQDLCYYNFMCYHPLGKIHDFNHFFSNIGYVTLGILFLIITHRKESIHQWLLCQDRKLDKDYGVPQHFGLFYAMGTSLIFEGVLSACYHICPNIYNFQFDVTFMYVISVICMIKIYQSRHPDVNATANSTFFLIALILILQIFGVLVHTPSFWYIFTTVHIVTCFWLSLQVYYLGRIKFDIRAIVRFFKESHFSCHIFRPMYPTRFSLIAIINLCNWGIAIAALLVPVKEVSSYLLLLFIMNLMLYTAFYIIMKLISKETILPQPLIYTVLAILCWSVALYYFLNKTISWKKSPADSRMYNKPCALFNFYDNHDIWHFFSSAGLFFSFLVLLTLDDDLIFIHRSKIPVF